MFDIKYTENGGTVIMESGQQLHGAEKDGNQRTACETPLAASDGFQLRHHNLSWKLLRSTKTKTALANWIEVSKKKALKKNEDF